MLDIRDFDTTKLSGAKTDRGYNMCTSSGFPFWPLDPHLEDIRIEDIASHLSRICRFNGALRDDVEHYSVAQHCCLVSDHCPEGFKFEGLLHDAAEAYTGDIIKPIKAMLTEWKAIEKRVDAVIRVKFGLPPHLSPEVKQQDYLAVATEHLQLQNDRGVDWGTLPTPWPDVIYPWSARRARREFMDRFRRLSP